MAADTTEVWCLKADLRAPVAHADPYIHLDGLVAYAVSRELGYTADDFEDGGPPEYFIDEVPLRRYEHTDPNTDADEWVWAASAAAIATLDADRRTFDTDAWDGETAAEWFDDADPADADHWSTTRWRKRFDHDARHQAKRTQINTSSGPFKSYNAALPYAAADHLTFFFEPAPDTDPGYVHDLLDSHVASIGKKRSQGYGHVREYSLTEATGAVSSALKHDGQTIRSLPASWFGTVVENVRYERRTTRPPYWHPGNQTMAAPPYADMGDARFVEAVGPRPSLEEVVS